MVRRTSSLAHDRVQVACVLSVGGAQLEARAGHEGRERQAHWLGSERGACDIDRRVALGVDVLREARGRAAHLSGDLRVRRVAGVTRAADGLGGLASHRHDGAVSACSGRVRHRRHSPAVDAAGMVGV
jgi:hypothetical protein